MFKFIKSIFIKSSVQSKELTEFYRDYQNWLMSGSPHGEKYHRDVGLCYNLKYEFCHGDLKKGGKLRNEMIEQFGAEGLNKYFPFGKDVLFDNPVGTCHKNPRRKAWIILHLTPKFTGEKD